MSGHVPDLDEPDYDILFGALQDSAKYLPTPGVNTPAQAADLGLTRMRESGFPVPQREERDRARDALAVVLEGVTTGEKTVDDAAHEGLAALRKYGLPVPVRPPDDPHPELTL